MIKLLQKPTDFSTACQNSITIKIGADLAAYGLGYSFLTAWQQFNSAGGQTAVIMKKDSTLFVLAADNADFSELKTFLSVIGGETIQTNEPTAIGLGLEFSPCHRFTELAIETPKFKSQSKISGAVFTDLSGCYNLLYETPGDQLAAVDYTAWYADLSHKIRHGCALAVHTENAAAVVSHIFNGDAVLSGIAVKNAARNKGYGTALLGYCATQIKKGTLRVIAAKSVCPFYLKAGFAPCEKIIIAPFKLLK